MDKEKFLSLLRQINDVGQSAGSREREVILGKKDIVAKEFLSANERFADLFNFYLFGGRMVIHPEDLQERDSEELISFLGTDATELYKQKWRDLLRYAVVKELDDVCFVLLGVENQSEIHYAMPIKNMIYDAINYGSQVEEAKRKNRENKVSVSDAEFLSGLRKDEKLTPVITLTVYWGAHEWDGPRSLHEMLDVRNEELLPYIADYKLNLLVPQQIEDFKLFRTSIGEVLEIIKSSTDRKAMDGIINSNPSFQTLEYDAVKMVNTFTEMNVPVKEGEVSNMCKAWEDQRAEGIAEGRTVGIAEGRAEAIRKMIQKGFSKEVILDMDYTEAEYAQAQESLLQTV